MTDPHGDTPAISPAANAFVRLADPTAGQQEVLENAGKPSIHSAQIGVGGGAGFQPFHRHPTAHKN
jgi:hypothetical protein